MNRICYILAVDDKSLYLNEINGKKQIRIVQELFEKHFPVWTVTQHSEVTGWVCDYIPPPGDAKPEIVLNLKRADTTIILDGSKSYTEEEVLKYLNRKGTFIL